jgi:hypothetical protein
MRLKEMYGWKTQLPGLASRATSAMTPAPEGRIDAFNEQTFHQYLLNFIVADDQVCVVCFRLWIILIFALFSSR